MFWIVLKARRFGEHGNLQFELLSGIKCRGLLKGATSHLEAVLCVLRKPTFLLGRHFNRDMAVGEGVLKTDSLILKVEGP